jgi:hypothetical protein
MQVRRVLTRESTKAKRAYCASLTLLISRARRSRLEAIRSSAASTSLSRPGQFSLDRRANERARIREASRLRRALNAANQRLVQSDSPASCLGFYRLHTLYGVIIRARDRGVHECAQDSPESCTSQTQREQMVDRKTSHSCATTLYVPLPVFAAGIASSAALRE